MQVPINRQINIGQPIAQDAQNPKITQLHIPRITHIQNPRLIHHKLKHKHLTQQTILQPHQSNAHQIINQITTQINIPTTTTKHYG